MALAVHQSIVPLGTADLEARLAEQPRVRLAHLPTPLDLCPRLSEALGGPKIYIKRDDMTGLAFGGNKTRHLEFVFAEVLASGADTVVAGAYTQSNWCRQITAAACRFGLQASLVLLHGEKGPKIQGNLLLDRLMGAEVTVVELDTMEKLTPLLEAKAAALAAQGRKPYLVAPFSLEMQATSSLGYVNAALELDGQLAEAGVNADHLYMAGANMTPAGMMAGLKALGRETRVVAITPVRWEEDRATDIARVATATLERLSIDLTIGPEEVACDDSYIGERYGVVTPESRAALKLVASTEGIFLDPVYSSKAMAGLIDHIRQGRISKNETVVFVHTGGTPALFAYAEDMELACQPDSVS